MAKEELAEEIHRQESKEEKVTAENLDIEPKCAHCERKMPYERYNEHSPGTDYVSHIVPGGDKEPPEKILYCGPSCFMKEMTELTEGAIR